MVLDGTEDASRRLKSMLHWDVVNGLSRRAWARNEHAVTTCEREMERAKGRLVVTMPNRVEDAGLVEREFPGAKI
jgi:urocanate hydratase